MNHLRSAAAAKPLTANPAQPAAALQRVDCKKVGALFKDFDQVGPVVKKRDLVFRICTKLDLLSQMDELDFGASVHKEDHGAQAMHAARRPAQAANGAVDPLAAEVGGDADADAVSPDMFSIGSRIAGRMEQIMGALHT